MENTEEQLEVVSSDVIYQQDKASIDMQISTAKAYPRNITKATNNAIAIATMDPETADSCNYSVPRGGKAITGPSIHLAKILAQCWGNMRIEAKVVAIDLTQVTSEGIAFDLESNLAIKTQVKRSIMQNEWVNGKKTGKTYRMNDDMITVTGNAANSIALRNAIFAVIPKSIVDKAYKSAKKMITGDLSDNDKLIAKRKQVFDKLKDTYSITEIEILSAIGKAAIDHVTPDDIVILIGIGTAIKDGDTTVDQAFRPKKNGTVEVIDVEHLQQLLDEKIAFLNKAEFDDAKRIIDKQEKDSYVKLHKILTDKKE